MKTNCMLSLFLGMAVSTAIAQVSCEHNLGIKQVLTGKTVQQGYPDHPSWPPMVWPAVRNVGPHRDITTFFISTYDTFAVTCNQPWCSVATPNQPCTNGCYQVITAVFESDTGSSTRTATITMTSDEGESASVTLNQIGMRAPRNLSGYAIEDDVQLSWSEAFIPDSAANNFWQWDPLFAWITTPSQYYEPGGGQYGVETLGDYIYTSVWGGDNQGPPWFAKYNKYTGELIETFNILGVDSIRDLACDGQYFYGSDNSSVLYKMNFNTHDLVIAIITDVPHIRHVAYDPVHNGFWCGGWSDINLITMNGTVLATVTAGSGGVAGSAYDGVTPGGPYLWTHEQDIQVNNKLQQWKITGNTLTNTGVWRSVTTVPGCPGNGVAGGLCTGYAGTQFVIIALTQSMPCFVSAMVTYTTTGPKVPVGLLGYNAYSNYSLLNYYGPVIETNYLDQGPVPGLKTYRVRAKYDLTNYGYPGFYKESNPAGPIEVFLPPIQIVLQGITIWPGQSHCFDAIQTIWVAGGESEFIVEENGEANLLAGSKIALMNGTWAKPGSYLHAAISQTYCASMPVKQQSQLANEAWLEQNHPTFFTVYPNPAADLLNIRFHTGSDNKATTVRICDLTGRQVLLSTLGTESAGCAFPLSLKPGIYILYVNRGNLSGVTKFIKL